LGEATGRAAGRPWFVGGERRNTGFEKVSGKDRSRDRQGGGPTVQTQISEVLLGKGEKNVPCREENQPVRTNIKGRIHPKERKKKNKKKNLMSTGG